MAGLLMLLVAIGGTVGYYAGISNQRSTTSVSISTTTLISISTSVMTAAQEPSIQLTANLKPSIISEGQNISIITNLYNPLPVSITLNASEILDPSEAPCGLGIKAIGINIYSGHYSFGNLSKATPLLLYNFSGPPPPCAARYNYTYAFQPNSDNATVEYLSTSTMLTLFGTQTIFAGFWQNCISPGQQGACAMLQKFQPGQYTVLVFDAWGQQVIEYFGVRPSGTPSGNPACGSTISGNVTLTADMSCPGDGLIIGADRTVLNCLGYGIGHSGGANGSTVGIYESGHKNVIISGCSARGFHFGFEFSSGYSNELTNDGAYPFDYVGFYIHSESNDTLLGNYAQGDYSYGFWFDSIHSSKLTDNFANENTGAAFFINGGSGNTFKSNHAGASNAYGFYLDHETNDTISTNFASTSVHEGFYLSSTTSHIALDGNLAYSNTSFGFFDQSAGGGTFGTANTYAATSPNSCDGKNNGGGAQSSPPSIC